MYVVSITIVETLWKVHFATDRLALVGVRAESKFCLKLFPIPKKGVIKDIRNACNLMSNVCF